MDLSNLILETPILSFFAKRLARILQRRILVEKTNAIRKEYRTCLKEFRSLIDNPGNQSQYHNLSEACMQLQNNIDDLLQHYSYLVSDKNQYLYDLMHDIIEEISESVKSSQVIHADLSKSNNLYNRGDYISHHYREVNNLPGPKKLAQQITGKLSKFDNFHRKLISFCILGYLVLPSSISIFAWHARAFHKKNNPSVKGITDKQPTPKPQCTNNQLSDISIKSQLLIPDTYPIFFSPLYEIVKISQLEDPYILPSNFQSESAEYKITILDKYLKELNQRIESLRVANDYQSNNKKELFQKRINLIQRYMPLLHILANNEKIVSLSRADDYHVFSVAIIVPLTNKSALDQNGPYPWSLGVLRGVDLAQKQIWKENQVRAPGRVFLKALIYDDNNNENPYRLGNHSVNGQLPQFLADPSSEYTENIIGVIGHNQGSTLLMLSRCYDKFKLPVFSTSIIKTVPSTTNYVHSLLPTTEQIVNLLFFTIDQRRKYFPKLSSKDTYSLVAVFDSRDPGGVRIVEEICRSKNCKRIDISNETHMLAFDEILLQANSTSEIELFLALNPNLYRDDVVKASKDVLHRYLYKIENSDQYSGQEKIYKADVNSLYVGPDFLDETLEKDLQKWVNQAELAKDSIDIVRIGPKDWRANADRDSAIILNNVYGPELNWTVYNARNAMLAYKTLINKLHPGSLDSFSEASQPIQRSKNLSDLRQIVNGLINSDGISLPEELGSAGEIHDGDSGLNLYLVGSGYQVCSSSILIDQRTQRPSYEANKCYNPLSIPYYDSPVR